MATRQYSLKELRARHNYTQKDMAEKLGISYQTYNAWENDVANLSVRKVMAIANIFGVSLAEIFFNEEHENDSCNDK